MDDVIDTRRGAGGDATQLARVKRLIDQRMADGHGDGGFSSLVENLC